MSEKNDKLGGFPFVIGGLSFIPLIGVAFGIVAIIWGIGSKKVGGRKLATIGGLGIGFSIVLYGGLFYFGFVQRGGIYDRLRAQMAQPMLNSAVQAIEFYRVQHGTYPESLEAVQKSQPSESFPSLFDPMDVGLGHGMRYFFYERIGTEHYYLRGVGSDGEPFTADDLVPQVQTGGKIGLLIERQ